MKLVFGLTLALLLVAGMENLSAQTTIRGLVIDGKGKPVAFANVVLLRSADSSMVKGMVTSSNGSYLFENVKAGKYRITSTFLGYKQVYSPEFTVEAIPQVINIAPMSLAELGLELREVNVTGQKPLFEQKVDRTVVNVKNSVVAVGGTALDVLERSPGIVVDRQNNSLSMGGKDGVIIMINGKVNHMPLSAVVQLLAGMSSSNIEKIELITTPPAKFDAEGNAGYINIVMVNNPNIGTNGTYTLSGGLGRGETSLAGLNFNHRKAKINLYGDYSFLRKHQDQIIQTYRQYNNSGFNIENFSTSNRNPVQRNHNAQLGLDVQVSEKTILGTLISAYDNRWSMDAENVLHVTANQRLDTAVNVINEEINHWKNFGANLNLQHTIKPDEIFSANFDYLYYHDNNPVNYLNSYFDGSGVFLWDTKIKSSKLTPLSMWVGNVDYSGKLTKNMTWETGIKAGIYRFSNNVRVENFESQAWHADPSLTSHYNLKEEIAAIYTTLSISINAKTEVKGGLRYEYTSSNLGSPETRNIVDRQYGNLFPSFFISRKLDKNNTLNLSYSKRITRPTFNDMAPFVIFLDPNTFFSGNSALQPSISNAVNSSYSHKGYIFSVGYSFDKDPIARFQVKVDSASNRQIVAAENLKNMQIVSTTISLPVDISNWWTMQTNLIGRWQQINALYNNEPVRIEQKNIQIVSTQNFKLPKNLSMELTAFFQSANLFGKAIMKPIGIVNWGIQKKSKNEKDSWSFNISDVLQSGLFKAYMRIPAQNLNIRFQGRFEPRTFKFSWSHNFGNTKLQGKRDRSTASEEERRRVN